MVNREQSLRIMLGTLPGVHEAMTLTKSLIYGGCAPHCIFLMMARESCVNPVMQQGGLLTSIGEYQGTSAYCVGDWYNGTEFGVDRTVQQRRFAHLIDRFAKHYPVDWAFHRDLVRDGRPVGVVHLRALLHDEPTIARTVLAHSVTRVQISDLPEMSGAALPGS